MSSSTPEPETGIATEARPVVLVVDDNEKNLKLARDVLHAAGIRTLEASSAAQTIELAVATVPDLILLDLRLPDQDGLAVLRQLSADPRTAAIPVVALTAVQTTDDGQWLLEEGFAGYIEKPISVRDFAELVRGHCTIRGA